MRLSVSTGTTYAYPLSLTFRLARAAGLRGVELVLGPEAIWRGPQSVSQLAGQHGLTIQSVHGPILPTPGWPRGPQGVTRLIQYASQIESRPLVVLHVPRVADLADARGMAYQAALKEWRQGLARSGVRVAIETPGLLHDQPSDLALLDVRDLVAFAQEQGTGLVLDTVHVASLSYDLLEAYELVRGGLMNVHLSDLASVPRWLDLPFLRSYIKHHQLPGRGALPLSQLIGTLDRDRYPGLLTLELSPLAVGAWSPTTVRRTLAAVVAWVQERARGEALATTPAHALPEALSALD